MVSKQKIREIAQRLFDEYYTYDMTDEKATVREISQLLESELNG